jgi:pilus assembly protein CpaC
MFAERARLLGLVLGAALLAPALLAPAAAAEDASGASPGVSGGEEERSILLDLGQQVVLPAEGVRSYSEGTRGVVDVRLTRDASEFVVVGQEPGVTSLLFIMQDGTRRNHRIEVQEPRSSAPSDTSLTVKQEDNVRLDFYFVELDRASDLRVGLGWPESVSAGTFAGSFDFLSQSFQAATAVVEDQALLRLDFAQAAGWAKLMRKAAVITQNGKPAEFSGGGEVNIPVQGSLTTGIHRIAYGSTIEVLPRYDAATRRVEIALRADVSDLTDDRGSGAPGRVTSTIATVVNLELGQAIVLAGLTAESERKSKTGLPVLSQLPLLGLLFGTERSSRQVADAVVFIVPSVLDATPRSARARVSAAFEAYRAYEGGDAARRRVREQWQESSPTEKGSRK